jgi:hypothetical protein
VFVFSHHLEETLGVMLLGFNNKMPQMSGFSHRATLSHSHGGSKSKVKVLIELVPSEAVTGGTLLGLSP